MDRALERVECVASSVRSLNLERLVVIVAADLAAGLRRLSFVSSSPTAGTPGAAPTHRGHRYDGPFRVLAPCRTTEGDRMYIGLGTLLLIVILIILLT